MTYGIKYLLMPESPSIQIFGHGLAGAILAETLSFAGMRVRVWDDGGVASSQVAAGMFTPLTGRRMIPSWSLAEALPVLNTFYPALEKTCGIRFFFPQSTVRIFRSQAEVSEWRERGNHEFTSPFALDHLPFESPWGGCEIKGGGWVDLPVMLKGLKDVREQNGEWGTFKSPDLTLWAEGVRASENPLWKDVGWRNAHGDILTLKIPGLSGDRIYTFGKFLVPLGHSFFRCGATYAWDLSSPDPRPQGRQELEEEIRSVLKLPFEVVDHRAGIRPVAIARVPVAGPHPEKPDHWIFNGFGSKGVLMAPWMAERIRDLIQKGKTLPKETQATRRMIRQRDRERTKRKNNSPHIQ